MRRAARQAPADIEPTRQGERQRSGNVQRNGSPRKSVSGSSCTIEQTSCRLILVRTMTAWRSNGATKRQQQRQGIAPAGNGRAEAEPAERFDRLLGQN
jgi:hypothetical protein